MPSQRPNKDGRLGVVIITHRARHHLEQCLPPLMSSPARPRVLVVNSSSGDGTVERARELGAETWILPRSDFNHGSTREAARRRLGTDIVVMMSPDAYPASEGFLEALTRPIAAGHAAVAYARQIAHRGADPIAQFGRTFNYPDVSQTRSLADWERYGSYTHFCSNACAAWSNAALDRIGGFRSTLVSEETIAAAELLRRNERIAYVAEAVVSHTHATSLRESFQRQFDIGYTRELFKDLLLARESDECRGCSYLRKLMVTLAKEKPDWLPFALLDVAAKYLGYRAGRLGTRLPEQVCRLLSGQDFYWQSSIRAARPVAAATA